MNENEFFTNNISTKKYNLWMYWENPPNKTKPSFIKLCYDTVKKHCSNDFNLIFLDNFNLYKYFPKMRRDLDNIISIPQKTDYIRLYALKYYGGIWLDSDIIVFQSLLPLMKNLNKYDFVGFGCHDRKCLLTNNGYGKPANWVLISRRNGILVRNCFSSINKILDDNVNLNGNFNYHVIGRELIWTQIKKLMNTKNWDYYHYNSTCFERDRFGKKYTNQRFISNEKIDPKCSFFFIPLYNTAPGFPDWFVHLSKEKLLNGNMLVSRLFRKSLKNNFD